MEQSMKMVMQVVLILCIAGTPMLPSVAWGDDGATPLKLDLTVAQATASQTPAVPQAGAMPLSIRESIVLALKNNLDIQVEGFNPKINEQALIGQKAVFDPSAFLEATRSDNRVPGVVTFFGSGRVSSDLWDYNAGLRQTIPTGGTYELRFNNEYFNSSTSLGSTGSGKTFSSRFGLTLTQPLLRNFGFEANETNIRIATNNQSISKEQLRLRVSNVVTLVQTSYFDLIFAIQNLDVARQSLKLAQDLVALNKARVRAGVAAPVEVTQAEAQQAARVQDVINGEKAVQDAGDTLKVVMNLPISGSWAQEIQPTDTPTSAVTSINLDQSVQKALENRYEYKSAKLDIDNKDLSVRLTRNQLLPDLALTGSVFSNGGDQTYGGDISTMGSGHFLSYSVGVILTVPLGNRAAQSSYIQSKLTLDQAKTSLKNLELQIVQQVRAAVRTVETNARRIDANRSARVLAEEQLRVEQRRLEAGVSTTFNVLQFQRDLSAAQANEIQAITDYNKSLATLDNTLGTVLERNRIEM
jgi:outer membrane protein TolC